MPHLEACLGRVEKAGGQIIHGIHGIMTTHRGERAFHCLDIDGNLVKAIGPAGRRVNVMTKRNEGSTDGRAHRFGGEWTSAKLEVLAGYLKAYTVALKDKPTPGRAFKKVYIDAFAGTGYREVRRNDATQKSSQGLLFPDLAEKESQELLDGSARLALKTEPHFDSYIFIERSARRCAELEMLKSEFPELAASITVRKGDANSGIQNLCAQSMNWKSHRAVLFLDPYGMQVEWATIETIANTRAIDLWVLFPLSIGVNRMLPQSGKIPETWRRRLDLFFGTKDWYEEFYKSRMTRDLFGERHESLFKVDMETIGRYYNNRLKKIFAGVVDEPGVLRNSVNSPLYLLCFAMGNEPGKEIALRIAKHLLKWVR